MGDGAPPFAAQLRDCAALRPERMPTRRDVPGALELPEFHRARRAGKHTQDSDECQATARLMAWRAQVEQRNRSQLSALLWACVQLREAVLTEPELREHIAPLSNALTAWAVPDGAVVPKGWADRRRWVEAWGTASWWDLFRGAQEDSRVAE